MFILITFIKNNSLIIIKKKLILLYLLNVTDIICTLLLLKTGFFAEANIFMAKVVERPLLSLCLKVALPAILLQHLYHMIRSSEEDALRVSNIAINVSLSVYVLVNISHLIWIILLPFFMHMVTI